MSCVFDLFFCVKERDLVIRTRDIRLRPITRSSCVCDSCIYVKGRDILLTQDIHLRPITRTSCVHDSCIYVKSTTFLQVMGHPLFYIAFLPPEKEISNIKPMVLILNYKLFFLNKARIYLSVDPLVTSGE